eukprot:g2799.t1
MSKSSRLLSLVEFKEDSGELTLRGLDKLRQSRSLEEEEEGEISDDGTISWGLTAEEEAAVKVQALQRGRFVRKSTKSSEINKKTPSLSVMEGPGRIDLEFRSNVAGFGAVVMSINSGQSKSAKAGVRVGWILTDIDDKCTNDLTIRAIYKLLRQSTKKVKKRLCFRKMSKSEEKKYLKYAGSDALFCDTTEAAINIQALVRGRKGRLLWNKEQSMVTVPYERRRARPQQICGIGFDAGPNNIGAHVTSLEDVKSLAVRKGVRGGWLISRLNQIDIERLPFSNIKKLLKTIRSKGKLERVSFRPLTLPEIESVERYREKALVPRDKKYNRRPRERKPRRYGLQREDSFTPQESAAIEMQRVLRGRNTRQKFETERKRNSIRPQLSSDLRLSIVEVKSIKFTSRRRDMARAICVRVVVGEKGDTWKKEVR